MGKIREIGGDLWTVPNLLTFGRLVASPAVAYYMYKHPRKAWPIALAFALSDNVDGLLARLGDTHPELAKYGFRKSEIGRKADPFADKVFTAEVLAAGMKNGVIPKWLGALSLAQKGVISGLTLYNEAHGVELEVTRLGKRTEFLTNVAIGSLFIAESIEDEQRKQVVRQTAIAIALGGIAGASLASYGYFRSAAQVKQLVTMADLHPTTELLNLNLLPEQLDLAA